MSVEGLVLLRPWWLALVPLVLLAAWRGRGRGGALGGWERAVDPALMAALAALGRVVPGRGGRPWAPALAAAALALALAGPATRAREAETFRNLDGLVLVLDLSRSTTGGAGMAALTTAARVVLDQAGTRPVALVVFAGDAYLASPFSTDTGVLSQTVAVLDGATVPDAGSRPERGLALARAALAQARIMGGDVVLIGDGGGAGPAAEAEAARIAALGARLSTVRVAAAPGAPPAARAALAALARAGGGVAVEAGDLAALAQTLSGGLAERLAAGGHHVLLWRDHGRWLLLLALPPALMLFRRVA